MVPVSHCHRADLIELDLKLTILHVNLYQEVWSCSSIKHSLEHTKTGISSITIVSMPRIILAVTFVYQNTLLDVTITPTAIIFHCIQKGLAI